MATYLVLAGLTAAQNRSHQQAVAKGCTGETLYWWEIIVHPSNGQAALVILPPGDYGTSGLTAGEIASLQTLAQMNAVGWNIL